MRREDVTPPVGPMIGRASSEISVYSVMHRFLASMSMDLIACSLDPGSPSYKLVMEYILEPSSAVVGVPSASIEPQPARKGRTSKALFID
jgi:hypothetical protein